MKESNEEANGRERMRELIRKTNAYQMIKNAEERLHHAYLFVFPDGVFLRAALQTFAELFGQDERQKRAIANGTFSDCLLFPEENKKFSVEDAERIAEESTLKPVEGDRKLFLIADFADATPQAQNKLLKILEEPPKGVYFLLGASVISPVLPTVLSRVEKMEISPFSSEETEGYLRRLYPQSPYIKEAAEASGGLPSRAEAMLADGFLSELSENAYTLLTAEEGKLPSLCRKTGETKNKRELLSLFRMILRDALFLKSGERENLLLPVFVEKSEKIAKKYDFSALFEGQTLLSEAEKDLKFNGVFSQTLELFLLRLRKSERIS